MAWISIAGNWLAVSKGNDGPTRCGRPHLVSAQKGWQLRYIKATSVETLHSRDGRWRDGDRMDRYFTDSVQLSGFTDRLSQIMQEAATSRAQRITEMTAAVRSGSYQVDAKAVSQDLVSLRSE